jgi:phosphatidylglycerophosphatase C
MSAFVRESAVTDVASAVFDLDGTLLAGDSTGHWLNESLCASPFRLLAGLALLPAAGPLLLHPASRPAGAIPLFWLATFGLDEVTLRASFAAFVARLERGQSRLRWRARGLETLERHLAQGHRVVVVTGAPALLARALLASRGLGERVTVLGTVLGVRARGWTVQRHCHGAEKCAFLAEAGYGSDWSYAYSDSAEDAPILARARQPFLVNASPRVVAGLQRRALPQLVALRW